MRLRKSMAGAAATLILVVGATGMAAATGTDVSDTLYAHGLEKARSLAEKGNAAASLEAAAAVIALEVEARNGDGNGDSSAADALRQAAETIRDNGSDASDDVHERVATLLEYLADAREGEGVDGQQVAEIARGIGGPPEVAPVVIPEGTPVGPVDGPPVEPPEGTPGGPPVNVPTG